MYYVHAMTATDAKLTLSVSFVSMSVTSEPKQFDFAPGAKEADVHASLCDAWKEWAAALPAAPPGFSKLVVGGGYDANNKAQILKVYP